MAPKRRDLGGAAAPGTGAKRPRAAAPGGAEQPRPARPSPGKRLWATARTVLVVLFFIREGRAPAPAACVDSIPRIGRALRAILTKLGRMEQQLQALTHRVDKLTRSSPTPHNQQRFRQGVNHEGDSAEAKGLAATEGEGENTCFKLRFLNGMKSPTYHDDDLRSESNAAIKIGIFDGDKMIKSGPLSKVKIEILALEGNFPYGAQDSWTAKEFNKHRAGGRDGKGDVLAGEGTTTQLINGECDLGSIRFREGSCRARKGMFIVGARVRDGQAVGVRVQEAVMNPVVVQDRRNKSNEKRHPPKLNDRVHRLEEIAKDGRYFKRLEQNNICTVEKFLKALNKDPNNLADILQINKEYKPWKKMTSHARECCLEGKRKLKSYTCSEKNVKLFFNCVDSLVGAEFVGGHYTPYDKFNPEQQDLVDELKKCAYAKLEGLPEDHVMTDNSPHPIHMVRYAGVGAGTSYMSTATQQNCSGRLSIHQVEPSCEIANNGLSSSISGHPSIHDCHVEGIPAVEVFNHGPLESPCSIANNGPRPSFPTPDHPSTPNYHDEWTRIAGQEQFSSALPNDLCRIPPGLSNPSIGPIAELLGNAVAPGFDQSQLFWPCNDTSEASISAYSNMALAPQQPLIYGAPRSAQGTQMAPLTNNGTAGSSEFAQQGLPSQQWSQCQGNMLGNGSL